MSDDSKYIGACVGNYANTANIGNVFISNDYGITWTDVGITNTSLSNKSWSSIVCNSTGSVFITSHYGGNIYYSSNYGVTWNLSSSFTNKNWRNLYCNDNIALACEGTYNNITGITTSFTSSIVGNLYKTTNNGATWSTFTFSNVVNKDWSSICCSNDGTYIYATQFAGSIYSSIDSGTNFNTYTPTTARKWYTSIKCSNNGQYVTAVTTAVSTTYSGTIQYSNNYGSTYTNIAINTANFFNSICMSNDGLYQYALALNSSANAGNVFISTNNYGFNTYNTYKNNSPLSSISCNSTGSNLLISDLTGNIYTSFNNGITYAHRIGLGNNNWTDIVCSNDGKYISAINGNATIAGYIYTSNDYGNTWYSDNVRNNIGKKRSSLSMSSLGQYIYATVYAGSIFISSDYGNTWTENTTYTLKNWSSIATSSLGKYVYATVYGGNIFSSTDYGITWTENTNSTYVNKNWNSICCIGSGQNVFSTIYQGSVYVSTDYAKTWQDLAIADNWNGVACSVDGKIAVSYTTTDNIYVLTPTTYNNIYADNMYVTGNVTTTNSISVTSDYRLKSNVLTISGNYYSVDVLRPVTYLNKITNNLNIGLIAHEVQEYYPFLVNGKKDDMKLQSINYNGFIGILTKEVQELKNEVKKIKDML